MHTFLLKISLFIFINKVFSSDDIEKNIFPNLFINFNSIFISLLFLLSYIYFKTIPLKHKILPSLNLLSLSKLYSNVKCLFTKSYLQLFVLL